jgi:hypothetical protein
MNALGTTHDIRADDRYVYRPRASARRLYYPKSETVDGPVTRRPDQQFTRWSIPMACQFGSA